jgi:hypothetical protein
MKRFYGFLGLGVLCLVFLSSVLFAQFPNTPQPSGFQPVLPQGGSGFGGATPMPNVNGQVQLGATAQDVINQNNSRIPYYGGNSPASTQAAVQAHIKAQMARDPAYNPALRNGVNGSYTLSPNEDVKRLLSESRAHENPALSVSRLTSNYYKSQSFIAETKGFNEALKELNSMLLGTEQGSLAKAFFTVEHAYGNSYLSQKEFEQILRQSSDFIKQWMTQNKLSLQSNEDVHLAVQKFMGESLTLGESKMSKDRKEHFSTMSHQAFYYDFSDNGGEKDFRNFFLTKCLATGSGQCSSLPAVYLCFIEALGGQAFLSMAPQHTFIKYRDRKGNVVNYEPTSHWKISDKWYQDNMMITAEAIRNKIYLDTLNTKQIIADCVLRLAHGYLNKFGAADGSFINSCIDIAQRYSEKTNLQGLLIRSSLLARMLNNVLYHAHIVSYQDLGKSAEASELYKALSENEKVIHRSGYQEQPKALYEQLLQETEFRGQVQDSLNPNSKTKHSLFIRTN